MSTQTNIHRTTPRGFGGRTWPEGAEACWHYAFEDGVVSIPPPGLTPRINAARADIINAAREARTFPQVSEIAARLSSSLIPPGFERQAPNLTGQWRGSDGGAYYINEPAGSNDVVWYAEHPLARLLVPGRPPIPARGWANVFFGERSGANIEGLWADVPRGGTFGAGRLELRVEGANIIRITRASGGYGGNVLQHITSRDVSVQVESLTINDPQEKKDEPIIYLLLFKLDGDTVDRDNLASSTATVVPKPELRFGELESRIPVPIAEDLGRYRTILTPVRTSSGRDVTNETRIGVIAYAIEHDRRTRESFRRVRHSSWMSGQASAINRAIHRGEILNRIELQRNADQILTQFRFGDTDDLLSSGVDFVSLRELIETPNIERQIVLQGSGARYTLNVRFDATSRINDACA